MNEKKRLVIWIGVFGVVLVLLLVLVVLTHNNQSSDPNLDISQADPTTSADVSQDSADSTTSADVPQDSADSTTSADVSQDSADPTTSADVSQDSADSTTSADMSEDSTESATSTKDVQNTTKATNGTSQKPETSDPTEEQLTPPEEQPPSVVIPPEKDPDTGEEIGISFPCQIPGYDLIIEKMEPYSGMFVEDGSNATIENVAMLLVKNNGDFPVEYAQIRVVCGQEELLFDVSALPSGEKLVVQEKTGKTITSGGEADSASALIVQRAKMEMSESKVQVIDNGDNTLTIKNLTNELIPTVRVFYKYYMEDEKLFVGGIAFTVRISRLAAGASVTIQPSHYTSQTSRVVMVLDYASEV